MYRGMVIYLFAFMDGDKIQLADVYQFKVRN